MNSGSVAIKIAAPADIPSLAGVQLRSALAGFAHIFPASIPKPTQVDLECEWETLVAGETHTVLCAEVDSVVAGAVVFGSDSDERFPSDAVLLKLYVPPEYSGRGLGGTLHDRAVADLASAGFSRARLWVLERNLVARRMYERRGWQLEPWSRTDWPGSGIIELGYSLELERGR